MFLTHQPTKTAIFRFPYRAGKRQKEVRALELPSRDHQQESRLIQLPRFSDHRGSLSFIEEGSHIPFEIQTVYWIHDMSETAGRMDRRYRRRHEFMVALSGRVEVVVENGREKRKYWLDRPDQGLYLPNMIWRQLKHISANAVLLVLASPARRDNDFWPEPLSNVEVRQ